MGKRVQFSQGILADLNLDGKPDLVTANWCCTPNYAYKGSAAVLLNVFTDATTTTLSSSLNPSTYGQKVTWTAKVATSRLIPPTGRVIFRTSGDGQNYEIGAAALDASGAATLTRSTLNVPLGGSYPMVAVYLGDTMNSRSQSEVVLQNVRQTTSVATITSSRNPSSPGQAVTFTAAIKLANGYGHWSGDFHRRHQGSGNGSAQSRKGHIHDLGVAHRFDQGAGDLPMELQRRRKFGFARANRTVRIKQGDASLWPPPLPKFASSDTDRRGRKSKSRWDGTTRCWSSP